MNTRSVRFLLAALAGLFLVTFALADAPPASNLPPPASAADAAVGPTIVDAKLPGGIPVAAILSIVSTIVVAAAKWAFDQAGKKIPAATIPLVALVVSYGLDWLTHLTFGTASNGWLALGAGLAAVGLNQLKKQLTQSPPPPVNLG